MPDCVFCLSTSAADLAHVSFLALCSVALIPLPTPLLRRLRPVGRQQDHGAVPGTRSRSRSSLLPQCAVPRPLHASLLPVLWVRCAPVAWNHWGLLLVNVTHWLLSLFLHVPFSVNSAHAFLIVLFF